MADNTSNSLINLGDLSKPMDTLIKKVSDAVGGVFAPRQIVRIANAKAQASPRLKPRRIFKLPDLQRRAMYRVVEEEGRRQKNIEDITAKALPLLTEGAKLGNHGRRLDRKFLRQV